MEQLRGRRDGGKGVRWDGIVVGVGAMLALRYWRKKREGNGRPDPIEAEDDKDIQDIIKLER